MESNYYDNCVSGDIYLHKGFWCVLVSICLCNWLSLVIRDSWLSRLNTLRLSGQLSGLCWPAALSSAAPGGTLAAPVGTSWYQSAQYSGVTLLDQAGLGVTTRAGEGRLTISLMCL